MYITSKTCHIRNQKLYAEKQRLIGSKNSYAEAQMIYGSNTTVAFLDMVGKTALVLEVVKKIVQDIWDGNSLNDYKPEYILFFSAKKNKLEIASATGKIIERTIHRHFENSDELTKLILNSLGLTSFRDYHKEGIIIVDNLESLPEDERQKIKHFIEAQTPSEMQFLITSRNSEEYEMNFRLSGFEHDSGVNFIN